MQTVNLLITHYLGGWVDYNPVIIFRQQFLHTIHIQWPSSALTHASSGWQLTHKQMRKLDGEDNSLLQCLLGSVEPSNVIPVNIGLIRYNGT